MNEATVRQREIFNFIASYQAKFRCSPTYREICRHFGFVSPMASFRHVKALVRKGYLVPIVSAEGHARGWHVTLSRLAVNLVVDRSFRLLLNTLCSTVPTFLAYAQLWETVRKRNLLTVGLEGDG